MTEQDHMHVEVMVVMAVMRDARFISEMHPAMRALGVKVRVYGSDLVAYTTCVVVCTAPLRPFLLYGATSYPTVRIVKQREVI